MGIEITLAPWVAATAAVWSVLPSSTTMYSAGMPCSLATRCIDSSTTGTAASSLKAGITNETGAPLTAPPR
jgi:hypothetical protein